MAQKKNKDRKKQLENFKQKTKKKMSEQKTQEQLAQIPQIQQYPVWNANEVIEVSGLEWENILNVLNIFRPALIASESVMQRNLGNGKIKMKYVDAQGQEVPQEKVDEYKKQLEDYFRKQRGESKDQASPVTSKIVTPDGEPATSEYVGEVPTSPSADLRVV